MTAATEDTFVDRSTASRIPTAKSCLRFGPSYRKSVNREQPSLRLHIGFCQP